MDVKDIVSLAEMVDKSSLSLFEMTQGDLHIRMEKKAEVQSFVPVMPQPMQAVPSIPVAQPIMPAMETPLAEVGESPLDFNRLTEVKAPMVGVFYVAPQPGAEPFVKRGDRVRKGDVLCIIEAMKLLNEIVAEADGEIADICVENGQVVEFSQVLFKLF